MSGGWSYALYAICSINTLILAIQYIFLLRQFINCVESGRYSCPAGPFSTSSSSDSLSTAQNPAGIHVLLGSSVHRVRQFVNCVEYDRYACPSGTFSIFSQSESSSTAQNPAGMHVLLGPSVYFPSRRVANCVEPGRYACPSWPSRTRISSQSDSSSSAQNLAGKCMSFLALQYIFLVRQFVNCVESDRLCMSVWALQYIFLSQTVH